MSQVIKAVILGLGNQACEHLSASVGHDKVQIIAGVDTDIHRHEHVQAQFAELNLRCFTSLDELKRSGLEFDAMILALPHNVYTKVWQQILAFGKPLLKEKPLGRDYQEAKQFMQQAQQAGCGLQTAIQHRQHSSYQYLAQYIKEQQLKISEIHAHLHLGKGSQIASTAPDLKWRGDRQKAGGGALLDAGYHLVDLVQFIIGDFDVVSATMWNGMQADNGKDIEDRSWLMGCTVDTWIMLDTWVQGEPNNTGGFKKSEQVVLLTDKGTLRANREGVWHEEKQLFATQGQWQTAMQAQLTDFYNNIQANHWDTEMIWYQLPIMRIIDKAYWLSKSY